MNGVYVAVSSGGGVFRSTDAVQWSAATTFLPDRISAVTHDSNQFLAVSSDTVFRSSDGNTWSATPLDLLGLGGISSIAYGGGRYVAVGGPGLILTSTDAVNWDVVPSHLASTFQGVPGLSSVTYGGGKFVAVGYHGSIVSSTDGQTWTVVSNVDASVIFLGVTYGASGGFVAVGEGAIWRSADATTWTEVTSPTMADIEAVAYSNSEYVAVGAAGTVLTSQDGIQWHARSSNVGEYLYGVCAGGGRFVAVGNDWDLPYVRPLTCKAPLDEHPSKRRRNESGAWRRCRPRQVPKRTRRSPSKRVEGCFRRKLSFGVLTSNDCS